MNSILTASNIVHAISLLSKDKTYDYINPKTRTKLLIGKVVLPEGPIYIRRYDPTKGESANNAEEQSISTQMIWRVANAFRPNQPLNIDRVLGASYNTRSALETLLAFTSEFYVCHPGRIEVINSSTDVKRGHKHIMWCPDLPHELGVVHEKDTKVVISEIPSQEIVYDALTVPELLEKGVDIEIQRRHAQIQVALVHIGRHLGYRTWVAANDQGIIYAEKRLGETEGVLPTLREGTIISPMEDAMRAALLIDCIWFKNGKLIPAVMEIEHTTGVISGLARMKKLQSAIPALLTRYVIVAPDEDRHKVITEITQEQFKSLNARYFPYSAVEELWGLCKRRNIRGITDEFLDSYLEKVVN